MKKLRIFAAAALAFGMVACEDIDVTQPEQHPEEAPMTTDDLSVVYAGAVESAVNLKATYEAGNYVPLMDITAVKNLPAGSELAFVMEVDKNSDFAAPANVRAEVEGTQVNVNPIDWNTAFTQLYGRDPQPQDVWIRVAAFVENGTSSVRLGGLDYYYGEARRLAVTPMGVDFIIESSYYFVGGATTVSPRDGIEFTHADTNIYDDPKFTVSVVVTEEMLVDGNYFWKVVPKSTYNFAAANDGAWATGDYAVYGPAESDALTGELLHGDNVQWGVFTAEGTYDVTIDLEAATYDIVYTVPGFPAEVFLVGDFPDCSWLEPIESNIEQYEAAGLAIAETSPNSGIYEAMVNIHPMAQFRIYTALKGWSGKQNLCAVPEGSVGGQLLSGQYCVSFDGVDEIVVNLAGGIPDCAIMFATWADPDAGTDWNDRITTWEGGELLVSVDLNAMNVTFSKATPDPRVIYAVGDGCDAGWNPESDVCPVTETAYGSNIYKATLNLKAGGYFRFFMTLGSWNEPQVGPHEVDGTNEPVDALPFSGTTVSGQGCWVVNWGGGMTDVTLDLNANTVEFAAAE